MKKRLRKVLEALERNPRAFRTWEAPEPLAARSDLFFPKAKITSGKHDYRLLCICQEDQDGQQHVEALFLFPRKLEGGYDQVDYEHLDSMLNDLGL